MNKYGKEQIEIRTSKPSYTVDTISSANLDSQLLDNKSYSRNTINYTTFVVNNNTLMGHVTQISPLALRTGNNFSYGVSDKEQYSQYQKDLQIQVS